MQSAEQFCKEIEWDGHGYSRDGAIANIRARDREIVERCREMVRVTPIYIPGDGKREPLNEGFDAILRDLG